MKSIKLPKHIQEAAKKGREKQEQAFKLLFTPELKEAIKKLQQEISAAESSYNEEFESIKDFLRVHGYIKPKDFKEFLWWIYLVKLKQETFRPVPKITDTIFIEYHEYRKQKLLKKQEEIIELQSENDTTTFKNNFDSNPPKIVFKHFKEGLVKKGYLTEEELNKFLKAAFENKTKPRHLFSFRNVQSKQKIALVFYTYFKEVSQKPHGKQRAYCSLLGEYFLGYTTKDVSSNWSKGYKGKR
jgi:hypothetical protein